MGEAWCERERLCQTPVTPRVIAMTRPLIWMRPRLEARPDRLEARVDRLEAAFDRLYARLDRLERQWMLFMMVWSTAWVALMVYLTCGGR